MWQVEGWSVLADAQSALAHSCIVSYYTHSAKFEHLFAAQRDLTQSLQQKMEEAWVALPTDHPPPLLAPPTLAPLSATADAFATYAAAAGALTQGTAFPVARATAATLPFPKEEAKHAIRQLRQRLKDYLLTVQTEIFLPSSTSEEGGRVRAREGGRGTLQRLPQRGVGRQRRLEPTPALPPPAAVLSVTPNSGRSVSGGDRTASTSHMESGMGAAVVFGQQAPIHYDEA